MPESATGVMDTAIGNAIAGTILLSLFSVIIAAPFAIATAIYLAKFAKRYLVRIVRLSIEVLSGTPSIVFGMLGFALFVVYFKPYSGGFSLLSGACAMAFLILPVIARAAEESIKNVPRELEEGSYAVGANDWQTIEFITLPIALSGIVTGIILGFGRAAEESAVVIFTVGYSQYYPQVAIKASGTMAGGIQVFPFQNIIGTLPIAVYNAYEQANIVPLSNGFAAAFVLIMFILLVNLLAKGIIWYTTPGTRAAICKKAVRFSQTMGGFVTRIFIFPQRSSGTGSM